MAKKALHISKGVKEAPSVNPSLQTGKRTSRTLTELVKEIIKGNRTALAQGITMIESNTAADQNHARALLNELIVEDIIILSIEGDVTHKITIELMDFLQKNSFTDVQIRTLSK